MLIGITGHAQHGKDTSGQVLVDEFGFTRFAFADQLKALALDLDPIVLVKLKMSGPDEVEGVEAFHLSELVRDAGWEMAKAIPEVRRLLIQLGIGVRNRIGADAWVDACLSSIEEAGLDVMADRVVITDVRFPNEARWIQGEGMLLRVMRPGVVEVDPKSESEKYVDEFSVNSRFDIVAEDIEDLRAKVREVGAHVNNISDGIEATSIRRAYD